MKLPVGYGIALDTLVNRMDHAIGAYNRNTNQKRKIKIEPEAADSHENKMTKQLILAARAEMLQKHPDTFKPGRFYGAGAAGAVFAGPPLWDSGVDGLDPDLTETVYKFDAGPYEARMADAVMKAGLVGRNGLAILPRYISTHETSLKFSKVGLPIHVIHREDLNDAKTVLSFNELNSLSRDVGSFMARLQRSVNPQRAPGDVDSQDIGEEPGPYHRGAGYQAGWERKAGMGASRKELLRAFDRGIGEISTSVRATATALGSSGHLARQWPRMKRELRKLLEYGIVPCDLHGDNWGIRPKTGEISMRDAGCASVVAH